MKTEEVVDRLGVLKAQIADLVEAENELKAMLIAQGSGAYDGRVFRATVTESERAQLDIDAARRKLGSKWVKAHTSYSNVTSVRVVARVREDMSTLVDA